MHIKAIHQFHPGITNGDGVSNGIFFTQRLLRKLGFVSEIFCERAPQDLAALVQPLNTMALNAQQCLFVHHSLGYQNSAWLAQVATPKVLVYHNITPPDMLPPDSELGRCSVLGREQLRDWSGDYLGAIGDSAFNSDELQAAGYANVATLPLLVDIDQLRRAPVDATLLPALRDTLNLLFVGRLCENKRQLELLDVLLELLQLTDQPVRLILAGGVTSPAYQQKIERRIQDAGLAGRVVLAGKVTSEALGALYLAADAFVSMSAHEGFGMPLIEAMLHDVPVVAFAAGSIAGTMGEGGLISTDDNPRVMAGLLHMLLSEPALRRQVIAGQRRNLQRFANARLLLELADYLGGIGITVPLPPAARADAPAQPYWQIEGPFDSSYSLAIVNRELARALAARGNDVGLRSMEGHGDFAPSAAFLATDLPIKRLAERAADAVVAPDAALRFCYPPHVDNMPAVARMVHSYGWEETAFPPAYVAAFNRRLDLVTVLSTEVEKILRDNGVRVPIAVTGGGVDHLREVTGVAPTIAMRSFRFLHVSSCFPRKGVDVLLAAFGAAFTHSDDVTLVIKTFPNQHNDVARQLAALRERTPSYPHVQIIERDCSPEELVGLYQCCHAFVAPSRGEGLGLPMAEAMLFNLPVITTAWGGQRDFCDADTAWLCDYIFTRSETHFGQSHSVWAEPDVDHLAQLLREVHGLPQDQRSLRTNAAFLRIAQDFSWDRVAERTELAMAALARQPLLRKAPSIGWVSTWNKRCGIASYSAFLSTRIPAPRLTILADRQSERSGVDADNVVRCWDIDFDERLDDLFDTIIARCLDVVVIQYNFGFFSLAALASLIERLKLASVGVHCFFHATGDLILEGREVSLGDIAASLAQAERLYVHSLQDLNRLKQRGLVSNVVFFPQGVLPVATGLPDMRPQMAGLEGKTIIAAYGFLLPHKGLQPLIHAFSTLAAHDDTLHLLLVNALYPNPESPREHAACLALIETLNLSGRVTMVTDFLADDASLAWLQTADLVVFPYQRTQESSSAAVRMGLATGKPVVVTPLAIFDDVSDAVHQLSGTTASAIAEGLHELLNAPDLVASQQEKTRAWIAQRQWPLLSQRLLNIIDGLANSQEFHARHD